jgi:hypothetical protein
MIKMKSILSEQFATPSVDLKLAKQIYNAKGFVWDNEYDAVKAILAIKDINQFNSVQKQLQNLTGGRGIGQYVSEFIQVRGESDFNSKKGKLTLDYINRIIQHMSKIKAPYQSIKYFYDKVDRIEKLNQNVANQMQGQGMLGGQLAWETFAERAKKDPEFKHAYLQTLQLVTAFIPGVGLLVSTGIGLADAAAYAYEGDTYEAGVSTVFAIIPGMAKIVTKIPAVRWLGAKGMATLGEKMATSKNPMLNWIERQVIKDMSKYKDIIKQDMDAYFKSRARQETAKLVRTQGKSTAGKLAMKVGDGSIKLSRLGAQGYALMKGWDWAGEAGTKVWDKIYRSTGLATSHKQDILKKQGTVDNLTKI